MGIYFTTLSGEKDAKILDRTKCWLGSYFEEIFCSYSPDVPPNDLATVLSILNDFREHRAYPCQNVYLLFEFYEELDYDDYGGESSFLGKPGAFFYIDSVIFCLNEDYMINPGSDSWRIFLTYKEVGLYLELAMIRYFESELCHFTREEKNAIEEVVKEVKHKLAMDDIK